MSAQEAADRAGISRERWRVVVGARRSNGRPFTPEPETIAKLADALDIPARAFEKINRPDVAAAIRAIPRTQRERTATLLDHLIALRETFGEEVFQAAVSELTKGRNTRAGKATK
jgi:transcriptional regulator with XRE-family HTH domain